MRPARRDQLLGRLIQPAEQADQGRPVRLAQRTEDLREQPLPRGVRHVQGGLAGVGDRDELGPAVCGIRPALGHAETLQPVDDVGDGVRGQLETGRQHALPGRPLFAEAPEYLGPGQGQAAPAHLVVYSPEHPVVDGEIPFTRLLRRDHRCPSDVH